MGKKSTETVPESSGTWESLEAFARDGIQRWVQRLLEEEMTGCWGAGGMSARRPSMRRPGTGTASANRAG